MSEGATIVIDLGKTLSKVSLWDKAGRMIDRVVRPNAPVMVNETRRLDIDGMGQWLIEALSTFAGHGVDTIVPVGHGAGVVALDGHGPAFSPLDYEQTLPHDILAAYREERDAFSVTGSPALPDGLNIGAQLFWTDRLYPASGNTTLVPWAQYWAWFLTGQAVSEVTSLGCHSDPWCPQAGAFAPMATRMGWAGRFAPVVRAGDTAGTLKAEIAARTGLSPEVRVLAGLHDSNAALLAARGFPEIARNEATVLSTGTWFIAMRLAAKAVDTASLPESRDCLVNVDAFGTPVPSARFMGGREIESVIGIDTRRVDIKPDQGVLLAAVPEILLRGTMLLPTLAPGFGPFPAGHGKWIAEPADWYAKRAAACLYAALVADTAMDLVGTRERILVEGRFAEAEVFVRALASLRPACAVYTANAHNDVSFGALRLIAPDLKPQGELVRVEPLPHDLTAYRDAWLAAMKATA